jgi:hypothetical protein
VRFDNYLSALKAKPHVDIAMAGAFKTHTHDAHPQHTSVSGSGGTVEPREECARWWTVDCVAMEHQRNCDVLQLYAVDSMCFMYSP